MPHVRKQKALQESSEGEDFGNDDFSDSDSKSDSESEIHEVAWEPIVVKKGAQREEYVKVIDPLLKYEWKH